MRSFVPFDERRSARRVVLKDEGLGDSTCVNNGAVIVWLEQRVAELSRLPVLLGRVLPATRAAKKSGMAPWLAWLRGHAKSNPEGLFCELDDQRVSYREAEHKVRVFAAVLSERGLKPGGMVALIGGNSPDYLLLILAVAWVGGTCALLDRELVGEPLAHALRMVTPWLTLVERSLQAGLPAQLAPGLAGNVLGFGDDDAELSVAARGDHLRSEPCAEPDRDFVLIFTSGTTGLPKPCRVRHDRARAAATIFGSVAFEFRRGDKLYCPLPLHHSSALLMGVGAALVAGIPIALRRNFSAREFFADLSRYDATVSLYIGETCRALLRASPQAQQGSARLRLLVGNGLDASTWSELRRRFPRVRIREFYASTEAPGAILNLTNKVGSLGHVPFERRRGFRLARLDEERSGLLRDSTGRAAECTVDEPGELLLRVHPTTREPQGEFGGYTDEAASSARVERDVFERGDAYFRCGDVLRRDRDGYFYFVDRLGDGYRWNGENISALQVERVLTAELGGVELGVRGVAMPGYPGRAGLVDLVTTAFDPVDFLRATRALPRPARPVFVRVLSTLERTSSFKVKKLAADLPTLVSEASLANRGGLWVRQVDSYVVLTAELWDDLRCARKRL